MSKWVSFKLELTAMPAKVGLVRGQHRGACQFFSPAVSFRGLNADQPDLFNHLFSHEGLQGLQPEMLIATSSLQRLHSRPYDVDVRVNRSRAIFAAPI
jgi:hypothetical protein